MILSKASLLVHKAATKKGGRQALRNVQIEADGTAVASNGEFVVAIEPTDASKVNLPLGELGSRITLGEEGVLLPAEMLAKTVKNFPTDKRPSLQHAALSRTPDPGKIGFITLDPAGNTSLVEGIPSQSTYPDWRETLRPGDSPGYSKMKVCVNRKLLIDMLKVVDDMSQGPGNVFLEIDTYENRILVRSVNTKTSQRVIAACSTVNTGGRWLDENDWEKGILSPEAEEKPKIIVRRKKKGDLSNGTHRSVK